MQYDVVDNPDSFKTPPKPKSPPRKAHKVWHAVTPDPNLERWDGVPSYAVVAFVGYLLALAVLFSNQIVPFCQAHFAEPGNCVPIFDKIIPVALAAIILGPAIGGAVRRMGGNRTAALAFSFAVTVVPPMMLGWKYLL